MNKSAARLMSISELLDLKFNFKLNIGFCTHSTLVHPFLVYIMCI